MRTPCLHILIVVFLINTLGLRTVEAGELIVPLMPKPGTMVAISPAYVSAHLKGITIHADNPFKFDFLIDRGDGNLSQDDKKQEYKKLVKYFLASLTIPDKDQWVNLSPYEHNRIIENNFGKTEMGRDLLAQDYFLKQITSSLMYPESGLGKSFWDKVYAEAYKKFGNTNIPVNTFNKVWIMPDEAVVYENRDSAVILKSHLKVMLEEDYLAYRQAGLATKQGTAPYFQQQNHKIGNRALSPVLREVILPILEKEVNTGKNFAPLRQVVSGMLLATWYKKALKESLLGKVYADKFKVAGVNQKDVKDNEAIYQEYVKAFKKGVYNYIKEDEDKYSKQIIPRKYFAGGFARGAVDYAQGGGIPKDIDFVQLEKNVDRASIVLSSIGNMAARIKAGIGWGRRTNSQGNAPTASISSAPFIKIVDERSLMEFKFWASLLRDQYLNAQLFGLPELIENGVEYSGADYYKKVKPVMEKKYVLSFYAGEFEYLYDRLINTAKALNLAEWDQFFELADRMIAEHGTMISNEFQRLSLQLQEAFDRYNFALADQILNSKIPPLINSGLERNQLIYAKEVLRQGIAQRDQLRTQWKGKIDGYLAEGDIESAEIILNKLEAYAVHDSENFRVIAGFVKQIIDAKKTNFQKPAVSPREQAFMRKENELRNWRSSFTNAVRQQNAPEAKRIFQDVFDFYNEFKADHADQLIDFEPSDAYIELNSLDLQEKPKDPVEVLGLTRPFTQEQLRARYIELSRKYHPNALYGKSVVEIQAGTEMFKGIGDAYMALSSTKNAAMVSPALMSKEQIKQAIYVNPGTYFQVQYLKEDSGNQGVISFSGKVQLVTVQGRQILSVQGYGYQNPILIDIEKVYSIQVNPDIVVEITKSLLLNLSRYSSIEGVTQQQNGQTRIRFKGIINQATIQRRIKLLNELFQLSSMREFFVSYPQVNLSPGPYSSSYKGGEFDLVTKLSEKLVVQMVAEIETTIKAEKDSKVPDFLKKSDASAAMASSDMTHGQVIEIKKLADALAINFNDKEFNALYDDFVQFRRILQAESQHPSVAYRNHAFIFSNAISGEQLETANNLLFNAFKKYIASGRGADNFLQTDFLIGQSTDDRRIFIRGHEHVRPVNISGMVVALRDFFNLFVEELDMIEGKNKGNVIEVENVYGDVTRIINKLKSVPKYKAIELLNSEQIMRLRLLIVDLIRKKAYLSERIKEGVDFLVFQEILRGQEVDADQLWDSIIDYIDPSKASSAMITPGGIDLNAANLNMVIKRDGKGMVLPVAQQDLAQISRTLTGFDPQIIEIKPAVNVPVLMEIKKCR